MSIINMPDSSPFINLKCLIYYYTMKQEGAFYLVGTGRSKSQIILKILDIHPIPYHFSFLSTLGSHRQTPVPHCLSNVASTRVFGYVVFNICNSGGFCRNFSLMPSRHGSYPSDFHHCGLNPFI